MVAAQLPPAPPGAIDRRGPPGAALNRIGIPASPILPRPASLVAAPGPCRHTVQSPILIPASRPRVLRFYSIRRPRGGPGQMLEFIPAAPPACA